MFVLRRYALKYLGVKIEHIYVGVKTGLISLHCHQPCTRVLVDLLPHQQLKFSYGSENVYIKEMMQMLTVGESDQSVYRCSWNYSYIFLEVWNYFQVKSLKKCP